MSDTLHPTPATRGGAELRISGITKNYGSVTAVDDVDLVVRPGEFVTLLGSSGSGKTTLLRMIAGFLEPSAGRILLDGTDITKTPVHKRNIGMVFQNYALFPHLSVENNVAFPLAMHKVPRSERKAQVDEALRLVRLESFGKRMPSELSGGQQQRVALARAIVSRPRLLLMDEPLGALDRRLRETMQVEITRLSRDLGLTVVNVTHDQEEAFTMSDRIALLADGALVQYSEPEAIYLAPASQLAAEFLGESNLLHGSIEPGSDAMTSPAGGRIGLPQSRPESDGACTLLVRPWSVAVEARSTASATTADVSYLDGTVTAVIYAGESEKILVAVDGLSEEFIVRQLVDGRQVLHAGDAVRLSWRTESTLVLGRPTTVTP
ncbi:ABC transporter ATP-binding protein [Pseudoclavibacter terrae]|uniref:ABC transporter ATP-binding protein n=1 Tax=Pseudoclavibacter terrae TaxID=1530195 RepID=UPI00232B0BB7|nr:ABC transporter ATP-binding protein [Pseudoclavibacter terrae]